MIHKTLDEVEEEEETEQKPIKKEQKPSGGHYERIDDLPGKLWYPEEEGASIDGIFMELRNSNKYESLIVIKEHKDKLAKENREETDETIVPGWAVLHKRFINLPVGTKIKITYTGEKMTKDGRGKAKQFEVEKWVEDEPE